MRMATDTPSRESRSLTGPPTSGILAPMSQEFLPSEVVLSSQDDTFCLAVIEFGGNLAAAYRSAFGDDVTNPTARARELMTRPEVARRIARLTEAVEESALISLGSHLTKLAEIRDISITTGQLKTALAAEVKRGEAAGFYTDKLPAGKNPGSGPSNPSVVVNIGTRTPANVQEWAARSGKGTVIVDV